VNSACTQVNRSLTSPRAGRSDVELPMPSLLDDALAAYFTVRSTLRCSRRRFAVVAEELLAGQGNCRRGAVLIVVGEQRCETRLSGSRIGAGRQVFGTQGRAGRLTHHSAISTRSIIPPAASSNVP